jgi:hypothetical protein
MLLPLPEVSAMKREFSPILLGEVISIKNESHRWRMLLQLAICARVNAFITSSPLVVQAVYLSGTYRAERYLAYADKVGRMSDIVLPRLDSTRLRLGFCRLRLDSDIIHGPSRSRESQLRLDFRLKSALSRVI